MPLMRADDDEIGALFSRHLDEMRVRAVPACLNAHPHPACAQHGPHTLAETARLHLLRPIQHLHDNRRWRHVERPVRQQRGHEVSDHDIARPELPQPRDPAERRLGLHGEIGSHEDAQPPLAKRPSGEGRGGAHHQGRNRRSFCCAFGDAAEHPAIRRLAAVRRNDKKARVLRDGSLHEHDVRFPGTKVFDHFHPRRAQPLELLMELRLLEEAERLAEIVGKRRARFLVHRMHEHQRLIEPLRQRRCRLYCLRGLLRKIRATDDARLRGNERGRPSWRRALRTIRSWLGHDRRRAHG